MVTTQGPTHAVGGQESANVVSGPQASVKYAVEAIGTFFLVFTVGTAAGSGSPFAPLGIGAALMVMVYAGGHLSGAHYNPAVTLAALVRRRIGLRDAVAYWVVQFGAGLLAAVVVRAIVDPSRAATAATPALCGRTLLGAFVVEVLFTFALCYVVHDGPLSTDFTYNLSNDLAIGFTVVAGAF